MISRIKFVAIPITDQDRALEFYTEKVGFRLVTDQAAGDRLLVGTPYNITFGTDDVNQAYAEMKGRGVEFTGPPTEQPWGTFAQFRDPDGNSFILSSLD